MTTRKRPSAARLEKLLRRPYCRIIRSTPEGFVGEVLELPGCRVEGPTAVAVCAELDAAARAWLTRRLRSGARVPEPLVAEEGSGRFALRLPVSLYQRARQAAAVEKVSLNQFITSAVAERLGGQGGSGDGT